MANKLLIVIIVLSSMLVLFLGYLAYQNIFHPAYLSYVYSCKPDGEQIIENKGYVVAGALVVNKSGDSKIVLSEDYADSITLKHELCHESQREQGRLFTCDYPVGKFENEVECYIRQYF